MSTKQSRKSAPVTTEAPATAAPTTFQATAPKSKCPVTKEQFLAAARPIMVEFEGNKVVATPREFSTGSFGWYFSGKTPIVVGGIPLNCQDGFSFIVVGSKPE